MKKNTSKHVQILFLAIAVLTFLVFLIVDYIVLFASLTFGIRTLIYLLAALFLAIIISTAFSVFNSVFSETSVTLRRMLRIESLSNPLLSKLSSEAPGTFHHSLNVSVLAQKAAKSIGADSLLVRIAAYYHDIGKLDNPRAYIENQAQKEVPNTDNAASIKKNAEVIISHVKRGEKITRENHLPEEIVDIIKEHHGTTRALFFYRMAKAKGLEIKETDFRYDGPVPSRKESGILMLSDVVEATARASSNLTPERIKEIVENTVKDKLRDNQLKNSNLSELELAKITSSLKENLRSVFHQRIEYKK
jgi:putative nucleotidyltransferase with HDIG domain